MGDIIIEKVNSKSKDKNEIIIKTENLSKSYYNKFIIKDVNLIIDKGETVAFIGENGSGKSTMLKLIAGLIKPSYGKVIRNKNLKIAYIPERFDKINMTIPEFIYHMGRMDGLTVHEIDNKADSLYQVFYLQDMLNTPIKFLSKGTLQKVAVIQALLVQPDILLLDEPLSGQDYLSQKRFMEMMLDIKKKEVSILMSCHEQFLIEHLADRVLMIKNKGFVETADFFHESTLLYNIMVFQDNLILDSTVLETLNKKQGVREAVRSNGKIRIIVEKGYCQVILLSLLQEGYKIIKLDEI